MSAKTPVQWINDALSESATAGEPVDVKVSVLLTRLQLEGADLDAAMHDTSCNLVAAAPKIGSDVGAVHEQTGDVRAELDTLLREVGAIESASDASVLLMRRAHEVQQHMAQSSATLGQTEHVARVLRAAEAAMGGGDPTAAAAALPELGASLNALGELGEAFFPGCAARAAEQRSQLRTSFRPPLLEAIAACDAEALARLAHAFGSLGAPEVAGAA
jgi:hypothetical protein